jgi:hypothetical protein
VSPGKTVAFADDHRPIPDCRARPVVDGRATCTITYRTLRRHEITAAYSGDSSFISSASAPTTFSVRPIPPTGFVNSFLSWTFFYTPSYTAVQALRVTGLQPGTGISLGCQGRGCPFAHHFQTVGGDHCGADHTSRCPTPSAVDLTPLLAGHALPAGTNLTVMITHRSWLGKYYRFTLRAAHTPATSQACLAVDLALPGLGCTSR